MKYFKRNHYIPGIDISGDSSDRRAASSSSTTANGFSVNDDFVGEAFGENSEFGVSLSY